MTTDPDPAKRPALFIGTQLVTQEPACSIHPIEYYYQKFSCPRILINATNYGHCDILDPFYWEACHVTKFCKTITGTNLQLWREFSQGAVSAWIIAYAQGNKNALSAVSDNGNIPLPLEDYAVDLSCDSMYFN